MEIVSLAPSNTEILYALGAEDKIAATTSLCNYPQDATAKPSIGGWTNPKIDRLHKFEPDLVIASDDLQDGAVEEIKREGFEVLQVKPHTLDEVFDSIETIGEAIGHEEKADDVVAEMKEEIREIDLNGSPRVYCEEWMNPPMISGNWIPGLIERAGGEYLTDEGERSSEIELDELKDFDPEYIFMNVCGAGKNLDTDPIIKREKWQNITAVENKEVYVIDDSLLNRPSPRLIKGLKEIVDKITS